MASEVEDSVPENPDGWVEDSVKLVAAQPEEFLFVTLTVKLADPPPLTEMLAGDSVTTGAV